MSREQKTLESITRQIETKDNSILNKFIICFITISTFYVNSLLTVSSTHLGTVFNIQPNNLGVYISKLNTYRSVFTIIGSIISGILSCYLYKHLRYLCLSSLCLLAFTRLVLLITLYVSKRLGFYTFIVLIIEAFVSGMTYLSIVVSFPQYSSIIILATHISSFLVLIIQLLLSLCVKNNHLLVFRVQCWICLVFSVGSVGLWSYYLNQFYDQFPEPYYVIKDEIVGKLSEFSKKVIIKNNELKRIEKVVEQIIVLKISLSSFKFGVENEQEQITLEDHKPKILDYIATAKSNISTLEYLISKSNLDSNHVKLSDDIQSINNKIEDFNKKVSHIVDGTESVNTQIDDEESTKLKEEVKGLYDQIVQLNSSAKLVSEIDTNTIDQNFGSIFRKMAQTSGIATNLESSITDLTNRKTQKIDETKQKLIQLNQTITKLSKQIQETNDEINNEIAQWFISSYSPFTMVVFASLFQTFLHPLILPNAFLKIDLCYKINLGIIIISVISGIMIFFTDNFLVYSEFQTYINIPWLFIITQLIMFMVSLVAIHSIASFKSIIDSTIRVMIMSIVLVACFSIIESVCYVLIAKYVFLEMKNIGIYSNIILYYLIAVLFSQFLFSKLSIGYNTTRVRLGYTFPDFNSKSSLRYGFCFWITQTLKATLVETISDLRFNIRNYT